MDRDLHNYAQGKNTARDGGLESLTTRSAAANIDLSPINRAIRVPIDSGLCIQPQR